MKRKKEKQRSRGFVLIAIDRTAVKRLKLQGDTQTALLMKGIPEEMQKKNKKINPVHDDDFVLFV